MGKKIGGIVLLFIAFVMLMGFFRSDLAMSASVATALVISVVLPAGAGLMLLKPTLFGSRRALEHKAELRQKTLESEVLRLAGQKQGKLTVVEVVQQLAVTPEEAKHAMDQLALRGMAEYQVTESGVVVYDFHDVRRLDEKSAAKDILE